MKKLMLPIGIFLVFLLSSCSPKENKEAFTEDRMQWWEDAKFGMFIHWVVYSVPAGIYNGKDIPGGEWIMNNAKIPVTGYKKYASEFNPVCYNPEAWVKMVKTCSGWKYGRIH